jgi:putative FmdB family regulatory protein
MPIFDYQCQACGHTFDILQKAGEGALRKCPQCGKLKLKKLLAAPNFHLKGSGWYKTDFRDKGAARKGGDDKSADKAGAEGGKKGHAVDSAKEHSHDHGHSHSHGGHSHSHGGHTHSHGPGGHKH